VNPTPKFAAFLASLPTDHAEAISMLVGALTLKAGESTDPVAVLQIAIDSLTQARDLCVDVIERRTS
jgi:lipid-A-disaccharide synthase-like uncharacterized protein